MNQTFLRLPFVIVILLSLPALAWAAGVAAPVQKSGQTGCWNAAGDVIACANTGQDGDLLKGVAWPNPRFTKNNDATVTDNLTGLIWLENANCFGTRTWAQALTDAATVKNGICGLSDGSALGEWRLPSKKELESLVASQYFNPAVPNTAGTGQWTAGAPFTIVQSSWYWSSTTYAGGTTNAWNVYLYYGGVYTNNKTSTSYVWPVRGGQ